VADVFESRALDDERLVRERLAELARTLEYSHRRIAEDLGVSHVTVGNLLAGRQRMTIVQLSLLCQSLGTTVADVVVQALSPMTDTEALVARARAHDDELRRRYA